MSLHAAFRSGSPPAHAVDRTRRAFRPRAAEGHDTLSAVVLLGVIFSALTCAWLCLYAATVAALGPVLARFRVRRTVDGLAGAVLIGLGVRVATEAR